MEFRSRYYGRRLTPLLVVQSAAIWVSVVAFSAMMLTPVVAHGRPLDAGRQVALLLLWLGGSVCQAVAVKVWRQLDNRKVIWDDQTQVLAVCGHRWTNSLLSPGRRVERVELSADDILSVRVLRGRGTQLRLHTTKGFLCLTNDLQAFDALCDVVQQLVSRPLAGEL